MTFDPILESFKLHGIDDMDPNERGYYLGFTEALFHAQAQQEYRHNVPDLKVDVPVGNVYAIPGEPEFDPRKLWKCAMYLDDEGPLYAFEIEVASAGGPDFYRITVWCSEGSHGIPDGITWFKDLSHAEAVWDKAHEGR